MTRRGRPKAGTQISRELILSAAFDLLEDSENQDFSMRTLAQRVGVTPMALYSHFVNRDTLVREMSDELYARVLNEFKVGDGKPRRQLESLLSLYYDAVVQFPRLTLLIFATPSEFSKEVQQINQHLSDLLAQSNLTSLQKKMWLEILVDFTHGSAIATASTENPEKIAEQKKIGYQRQLNELLERIF